jgi:hypothetical protein
LGIAIDAMEAVGTSDLAAFIPNMQTEAAAGVDTWLRQALAEEVGGKSVARIDFEAGRKKLTD